MVIQEERTHARSTNGERFELCGEYSSDDDGVDAPATFTHARGDGTASGASMPAYGSGERGERILHGVAGRPRLGSFQDAAEGVKAMVDSVDTLHGGREH